MKMKRQSKILELIRNHDIETQEELSAYLTREGFAVTQATVSRDIRELKLTKIATNSGRQRYAVLAETDSGMADKHVRLLQEGFVSMDAAGNLLVIKTVSGMASAVGAAVDAMNLSEVIGSIAGDDTLMCVVRSEEDGIRLRNKLQKIIEK